MAISIPGKILFGVLVPAASFRVILIGLYPGFFFLITFTTGRE
jgi:hypothetical protein